MTHVFCILDRSGSMGSIAKATVDGFNEYLETLKQKSKGVRFNLTQFDHEVETPFVDQPIKDVHPLVLNESYIPRGMTALLDATCQTLVDAEAKVGDKDKALVCIITDGMENSSKEYTGEQMRDMVKRLEGKKNWTFTYLGANQDAWDTARHWGFSQGNVSSFGATDKGVGQVFVTQAANTSAFSMSTARSSNQFFSKEDKEKLEKDATS